MSALPLIIAPSILAADFGNLRQEALRAHQAQADWLHVDIMDGHFVPNISFGPNMVTMLRQALPKAFLDVHLMIQHPQEYIEVFAREGADLISFHVESEADISATLKQIRSYGKKTGLAINPSTNWKNLEPYLADVDLALCMTVNPGFGGQSFIEEVMPKVEALATYRAEHHLSFHIEVDGGINFETAQKSRQSGANVLVAGTSLFKEKDLQQTIGRWKSLL